MDGKALSMDVKPVIENSRTLVPLRAIFEALGARVMFRPGWKGISAVKNSRVYIISSDIYTGPRAVVGIAYFAKWIPPAALCRH